MWNKENMFNKLWDAYRKKDTIWVKWVNTVRLKGKSLWGYKGKATDSWIWRSIRKHRVWMYEHAEMIVGDEKGRYFDISRHSFILWLLIKGRLETRDRVSKWLPSCERSCLFCEKEETQEHLFFDCVYSGKVWRKVLGMLGLYRGNGGWRMEFGFMINVKKGSKMQRLMLKVASAGTVYFVWRERNRRMHGKRMRSEGVIIQEIVMVVADRLSSLRGIKCEKKDWE
ncbi:hypothetical protein LIER_35443 [Lithospermum erythrorhizon]|uniref:Reverse transcriptase zinc-binding domain-containing protein n=1 Tax=Lithospermum erythrorhizon TaxID=34254 RepID=A0AAV3NQR7_LITER